MANYTVKLTVIVSGVPSVKYLGSEVWPTETIRASNIQECYSITGLGEVHTYEYYVGTEMPLAFKNFSIKNKSVSHKLKVTLNFPSFLKSDMFTNWTPIAQEGGTFTVGTNDRVRYGSDTRWIELTMSGTNICNNETFGDPALYTTKRCEVVTENPLPVSFILDEDSIQVITIHVSEPLALNLVMQNLTEYSELLGVSVEVLDVASPVYVRLV